MLLRYRFLRDEILLISSAFFLEHIFNFPSCSSRLKQITRLPQYIPTFHI